MQASGGESSRVSYCVFTDPGGGVWKWIANQANVEAIPRLFQALRDAVKLQRYADAPEAQLLQPEANPASGLRACGAE